MEVVKSDLEWLKNKVDICSERYLDAEKFIIEIAEMPWWKRVFIRKKILKFLFENFKS